MARTSLLYTSEYHEMEKICQEKNLTTEKLLEEKLTPLKSRISESEGELIGALNRNYQHNSHGMRLIQYWLKETLHAGIITSKTRFAPRGSAFSFVLGIKKPFSLELSGTGRDFTKETDNSFTRILPDIFRLFYFMERPPTIPGDSWESSCYGDRRIAFPTKKPRLELYIGDGEAIPFFQKQLKGWRYLQLAELLDYNLPVTDEIAKKIEEEQLALYEEMIKTEDRVSTLIKEKKARIELVKSTGGVIHHGTHIELTDEFVENIKYNPLLKETREKVEELLKTAIKRKYHERGIKISKKIDAGVTEQIDLKEFFSQRKALFEL